MNWKKMLVAFLYIDFLALSGYAIAMEPAGGFWDAVTHNWYSVQVAADLVVALSFATVWMWRDAKRLGINPLPYALAVVPTGSIALFAYAMRRPWGEDASARVAATAA